MPRFLTPDSLSPGTKCRVILLPADGIAWGVFSTALAELAKPYNWQKRGEMSPEECADHFDDWLLTFENSTQECGEGMIQDVRVHEGQLQAQIGGEWVDKGALVETWSGGFDDEAGLVFNVNGVTYDAGFNPDFIVEDNDPYEVLWKNASTSDHYRSAGFIAVEDGAPGAPGATGATGAKGDKGDTGDTGAQGEPGADGANAPIPVFSFREVGNDVYLDIDSDGDDIVDVSSGNIRGAAGIQGEPGAPGEDGAGIDSVFVHSVPYGDEPTVELEGGVLDLGIPEGAPGATGATGAKGDKGDTGDTGAQGEPGADGAGGNVAIPPAALVFNEIDNICQGVTEMLAELWTRYNYMLDQSDAVINGTANVFAAVGLFVESVPIINLLVPIDTLVELVRNTALSGTSALRLAVNNPDFIDESRENLFCLILNDPDMAFSQDVFEDWRAGLFDSGGLIASGAMSSFAADIITYDGLLRYYQMYGGDTSNACDLFDCVPVGYDWEQVFDFETEQSYLGWYNNASLPFPTIGATGLIAGMAQLNDDARRGFYMNHDLEFADSTTRLALIEAYFENVNEGNSDASPYNVAATRTVTNGGTIIDNPGGQPPIPSPSGTWSQEYNAGQSYETDDYIRGFWQVAQKNFSDTVTGSGTLVKIIIKGQGKNPFEA